MQTILAIVSLIECACRKSGILFGVGNRRSLFGRTHRVARDGIYFGRNLD
jgi:hypothetical protein